jgi:sec-independent protein translocase protein TatB
MLPPTTFQTANLSIPDTFVLMVLALVVFGPRRLPEIGRQVGKILYEFRKASNDFKLQMEEELRVAEENDRLKKLQVSQAETPVLTSGSEILPVTTEATASSDPATEWTGEEYTIHTPPEEIPAEPASEAASAAPQIQPPTEGETVSATRPDFRANLIAEGEKTAVDQTIPAGSRPEEPTGTEAGPHHG